MTISDMPTQTLPAEGEVGIVDVGSLTLESGAVLDDVSIAVQRWGELSPNRDNVVVPVQVLGDPLRVGDVPLDPQAQRFQALGDQERVER